MRRSVWLLPLALGLLAGCDSGSSGGTAGSADVPVKVPTFPTPLASSAISEADARRLLDQMSFGPSDDAVRMVMQMGAAPYVEREFSLTASNYAGFSYENPDSSIGCPTGAPNTCFRDKYTLFPLQQRFFLNAINNNDQLRQRTAFALSQILVTSGVSGISQPYAMAAYQQIFLDNAFGNYRDILLQVTLSPAMGDYLDMVNNDKPNPKAGIESNENYAREILQLFSIGLWKLNPDGTQQLDANGKPIPSYSQDNVIAFAHAFTGWTYPPLPGATSKWTNPRNYTGLMVPFETHHDTSTKQLFDNVQFPGGQTAAVDLNAAITAIFNHPNVGPFIGKQLIQHLVTSNPSPAYVARVTAAFNDNGQGVRGDMKAVLRAILLDNEARGDRKDDPAYGKMREPILYELGLIRALAISSDGLYPRAQAAAMAQDIFNSPTVFNYYPPDFPLPNSTLLGPPFGIYNATTAFARANFANSVFSQNGVGPDSSVVGSIGTKSNWTYWQALAADPNQLVERINTLLFHGTMSSDTRSTIMTAVQALPASSSFDRARTALYLAATSPQYQIQR
ncbi:DUF1800 family protein [Chitinimonas sp.]|uniref:DUF1800 domain-containing protein n=1 Tax=Chitinimonas sp. TaxID=1934313 RepID=UPI0035AD786D